MCFRILISFQSQTFIVDEEGTRPYITAVLQDHVLLIKFLTILTLPIYNSFIHGIVLEVVSILAAIDGLCPLLGI